ncbi:CoA-binding protein [candidate division KSB1 bacterium]
MSKSIAIIGASNNPEKFGNKAVKAYKKIGYTVYPVNPTADEIEGLKVYRSILDIKGKIDRVSFYLPPKKVMEVLDDIAELGIKEVYLNPGTESDEVFEKAESLGLEPVVACSIVAVGLHPDEL